MAKNRNIVNAGKCIAGLALFVLGLSAQADTAGYYGTESGSFVSGLGTNIGAMPLPANLTLSDIIALNTSGATAIEVQDWTFSVANASTFTTSFTGLQSDPGTQAPEGMLIGLSLYSGTPGGSNTLLAYYAPFLGSLYSYGTGILPAGGNYFVQVRSILANGDSGSTAGVLLVNSAVPEPSGFALLGAGLAGIALVVRRRTRR